MMSATNCVPTASITITIAPASRAKTSLYSAASSKYRPRPGKPKIASTTTIPPISQLTWSMMTVMGAIKALRRACLKTMRQ